MQPRSGSVVDGASRQKQKQPLDIEEILRAKKAAEAAAAKPRFIPKAERERRAQELEQKQKQQQRQQQKEEAGKRRNEHELDKRNTWTTNRYDAPSRDHRDSQRGSQQYAVPTGPRAMRNGSGRHENEAPKNTSDAKKPGNKRKQPEEDEASQIRARYMGPELNQSTFSAKKKSRRHRDKFNFDWDPHDDTSQGDALIHTEQMHHVRDGGLLSRYQGLVEEDDMKRAKLIIAGDPETGRERAEQLLETAVEAKHRANRNNFGKHWSDKRLEDMRERDWRIFKEDFGIATKGGLLPNPMRSWQESTLPRRLLDIVAQVGYDEPTPVQRAAIPIALQARDLIGVAVTGSGKTAAFLLPLLVYISDLPPLDEITKNDGPYSLIIAPTRELVQQIETEAKKFASRLGFTVVSLVGGHSLEEQAFALRNGAEIIVATPGRLVDCIERRLLVLSQCCYIIMDEADRMIDMGFEEPVNKILDALPVTNEKPDTDAAENAQLMSRPLGGKDRYRQTMMYTATMPSAVEKIAKKYLRRPATVTIGNAGEAVDTVEQRVEFVAGEDRRKKRLQEILTSGEFAAPIIVFVNIKRNCDAVARDIKHMGFSTVTMHGSKTQEQREQALASVRGGSTDVLVATDLAGRGIDVPDVSLVVNFNMASSIESYTHRIGRTGRAGKSGVAITFLGNEDADNLYDLKQMLSKSSISKVPEELRRHESAQQKPNKGGFKKIE
ncbi:Pre-mRNA-splicing ATP-dependent RNA helicase prp-28 [Astrocystis sublimbata]|nr:Pre-mRNA-splicing ATP-dependent RNA helicase prp-28 [Astrocystis sublimbata]